jgi:alanine racemase
MRGIRIEGIWTHFARADEVDDPTTAEQLKRFWQVIDALEAKAVRPRYVHAANSAATIAWPESHLDLVRVGIAMYGVSPGPQVDGRVDLRPAMSLRSRVSHVQRLAAGEAISYGHRYRLQRDSTIATVPVGYADGYRRALSSAGRVLIGGRHHPVAGTVTMDQLMVDCADDPVRVGDEVVLFGRQGDEEIRVEEVAGWAGTIGYEVVCAVGPRVPRSYRG